MTAAPTSTYRLQLRKEFGFDAAAAVVPYLARLGISHVYCSPILQATEGSAHGYDVVDHTRLSDDLGGEQAWKRFVTACREHGLGIVVDVVPNHMAVPTPERLNAPLWDVLKHGRRSSYAEWFDIDWDAGDGKLLMPVLGRPLGDCLRDGEITIDTSAGVVRYYDHEFPLAPGTDKLDAQHYRLAHWRVANEELNYRRFFDVTTLIGVRVERPEVFDATHELILRLVRDGDIDGLRIDHPDGLADPAGYLARLRDATDGAWTLVEKILEGEEILPTDWACAGTTGYDAIAALTGVLTDPAGERPLTEVYARFAARDTTYAATVEAGKRLAVERLFPAEVDRLLRDLEPTRGDDLDGADLTARGLHEALVELLVQFGVYRAYADDPAGREQIDRAVIAAQDRLPHRRAELRWLRSVLIGEAGSNAAGRFRTRFAQTTGPATAKGVEDTAFYRYHRLVALNEVGGDPGEFGRGIEQWHEFCTRIARDWPTTMTTLSTHDTKRSEDVRARLLALAEIPTEWEAAVTSWRERLGGVDRNTDYLFWQTVVGAHPIDEQRLASYLEKATREAKERTTWTDQDDAFESGLRDLVSRLYADEGLRAEIGAWVQTHLDQPGRSNSLAQKLLQLTMPGVPDVYQGQELPDFSLVDPDNRRPVDYDARARSLEALDSADPKLRLTAATLRLRRDRPDIFTDGAYTPMHATGTAASHAVAFRRGDDAITVVTRLPVGLSKRGGWADTTIELPAGNWRNVLTDTRVPDGRLATLLEPLPVALLVRKDAS
jgi:(1->4)-alpha-D-glucan 1-alpha-D-glucosylmutase